MESTCARRGEDAAGSDERIGRLDDDLVAFDTPDPADPGLFAGDPRRRVGEPINHRSGVIEDFNFPAFTVVARIVPGATDRLGDRLTGNPCRVDLPCDHWRKQRERRQEE